MGIESFRSKELLEVFQKMCISRYFEYSVQKAHQSGLIQCPIYLSLGQESISAALSTVYKDVAIFAQHRCHDFYLSYGGSMRALIDELLGLPSGCAGGMGGSASIHCPEIKMFGHDGFMGTQVAPAVGYSMATMKNTLSIMGDASAEEGFVLGSIGFASTKKAPILFVCIDNNLSVQTEKKFRRNWNMVEHGSFGMPALEIVDDPWLIMDTVKNLMANLPALINILINRECAHAGSGYDEKGEAKWDRFAIVKDGLDKAGLAKESREIEDNAKNIIRKAWKFQMEGK